MDRWKEGYNDCDLEWRRKIQEKINKLEKEYKQFSDWDREDDCMITREEIEILEDLLKKG